MCFLDGKNELNFQGGWFAGIAVNDSNRSMKLELLHGPRCTHGLNSNVAQLQRMCLAWNLTRNNFCLGL